MYVKEKKLYLKTNKNRDIYTCFSQTYTTVSSRLNKPKQM